MQNIVELTLLQRYEIYRLGLCEIMPEIYKRVDGYCIVNNRKYKKYQNGDKIVECKEMYYLDDGDHAWDVNGEEVYGSEDMYIKVLTILNS